MKFFPIEISFLLYFDKHLFHRIHRRSLNNSQFSSKFFFFFHFLFVSPLCVVFVALFDEYFWVRRFLFLLRVCSSFAGGVLEMHL